MDHSASSSSDLVPRWEAPRDWLSCSTSPSPTTQIDVRDVTIEDNLNHDHDHDRKSNQQVREIGSSYGGGVVVVEREHMFDKVVTPSDVGKLNRLVIPKQHAEKYFPLDTTTTTSSTTTTTVSSSTGGGNNEGNRAGLLLNFEDRTGKSWRFRYSYWNSSQSYVMTKGWSRFVKEKQLTAGDIVSFQRGVGDDLSTKNRFFIDWRRRPPDLHHQYSSHNHYQHHHQHQHQHHHLGTAFSIHHHHHSTWSGGGGGGVGGGGGGGAHGGLFLRSHPHESHPNARPLSTVVGGVPTIWDHPNSSNNNNNTTHLSPMNGNIMSMVPYATYGSSTTTTTSVVSPSYSAATGSLILLRSPGSINNNTSNPHFIPTTTTHHHHHLNNLLSSQFGHGGSVSGRHDHHHNQQGGGSDEPKVVYDSVPVSVSSPPPGKRSLRLFGVNMDCTPSTLTDHTPSSSTSNSNFDAPQN